MSGSTALGVMTLLHAGFSGGAAAGALLSGAALWAGVGFLLLYAIVGISLLLLAAILWRASLPHHLPENMDEDEMTEIPFW